MRRVQEPLTVQLSAHSDKLLLNLKIHEKKQSVKKIIKKREDIGVELYSVQQQLARLQVLLEGTESSSSGTREEKRRQDYYIDNLTHQLR
jgi:hypothetical protein